MPACPRCCAPCGETHSFCFTCGAELTPASSAEDPLLGRVLPGGYRVTHVVGVGGMGRVYCAEQVALGRTVAVKVVHPHLAGDELAAGRFLVEARAASRLSHPNSVAIFDFGRTEAGLPYIVMEYLRGRDLGRVVADAQEPLPLRRIADVLRQTLAALEEAHALGIVHRDLKPDNIVLEPLRSGLDFVKVVDFGLAKMVENDGPASGRGALTRPGLVCGTPEYMSPEQGRGDPLDGRSDLYGVGVVLFELLAGRVPFSAETATKTLLLHLNEPVPDPRDVAPDRAIPAPFAALTVRALAKDRDARFQTARELSEAVHRALVDAEGCSLMPESVPTTGIRCRACGALNGTGRKFCGECGAKIAASTPPRSMPRPGLGDAPSSPSPADGAPRTPRTPSSRPGSLPLLARAEALDWLDGRLHDAEAMFAVAHVMGEAGSGKTRLLAELGAICAERGTPFVLVEPDPAWTKVGDHTLREAVRRLAELGEEPRSSGEWRAASPGARLGLDLLFETRPRSGERPLEATVRRRALGDALRWAIGRASERAGGAPIVLAVDDLDFVDGTSRNALADVLAEPPLVPALAAVAYATPAAPAERPLPGQRWTLAPLLREELSGVLAASLCPGTAALTPLHAEQLLGWARETNEAPPERLAELLARRVEQLPAGARHALHALAVWGEAPADVLALVLPPSVDVQGALDVLRRARFVEEREGQARIVHPLVRRVVFATIPAERKRELFARAAELQPDAPLEARAKHAMHGGSPLEALSLLDQVAGTRAARGDLDGSVSALRHALDVTRREQHRDDLDDPLGAMLVFARKLAEALAAAGRLGDAEGVLREALGHAPPTSEHRARLLAVLARVAADRKRTDDARRYVQEAERVARQSDARELLPALEKLGKLIDVA